jgi:transcriptional regulator GlxA family with amidase domain
MKRIIKYDNLMNAVNQQKIEELCKTINENCDKPMGWEQLTKLSGFTHKELIGLFQIYKQTTPMTFIKSARKLKKAQEPVYPQNQLFPKFIQSQKDQV